jgi:ABC-type amino acid transport substrate-binding protein
MKHIIRLLIMLPVFLAAETNSVLAFEEAVVIPISTEDYPPYEMKDPQKGLKGFDYELAIDIFSEMGTSVGILTSAYLKQHEEFILYFDPISNYTDPFLNYSK